MRLQGKRWEPIATADDVALIAVGKTYSSSRWTNAEGLNYCDSLVKEARIECQPNKDPFWFSLWIETNFPRGYEK